MTDVENNKDLVAPPYTSFQSVKTLLGSLKEQGVPSRIDRSVLTNFSGSVGSQIVTALRFLKLINGENRSTQALADLVSAYGTDKWEIELKEVLHKAYANFFATNVNLENCTSKEFAEVFKDTYPGAEAVVSKSRTFFLNAIREAGIPVTSRLTAASKPRIAPARRKAPKSDAKSKTSTGGSGGHHNPPPPPNPGLAKSASQIVFEAFDPVEMPAEVQKATLELITWLKTKGK
jgi:hypothetical protein